MKITHIHDETIFEATRWDRFVQWFRHYVSGTCDAWCSYCYEEAAGSPRKWYE